MNTAQKTHQRQTHSCNRGDYVTYRALYTILSAFAVAAMTLAGIAWGVNEASQQAQDRALATSNNAQDALSNDRWSTHMRHESDQATLMESRLTRIENKIDAMRDMLGP